MDAPLPVVDLAALLLPLGWVSDVFVGGSAATGDYHPGVSDLDVVAVVDGLIGPDRLAALVAVHRDLDAGTARGQDLGCVYVSESALFDVSARHPTWTHGALVERPLSAIARAELVRYGFAAFGRPPCDVLPAVTDDDVRRAAWEELTGYWAMAVRHPTWWLNSTIADLGLTSMARARHALRTGALLTKTAAIDEARAPEWLQSDLHARRQGRDVRSPRLRTGLIAWLDARRTTVLAKRWKPPKQLR